MPIRKGKQPLSITHPDLSKEWDYVKNAPLTPYQITFGNGKIVWWICEKGHSFEASPNTRTNQKSGCPYCSNKRALKGFNDLATVYPDIAKEWDYEKNAPLTPDLVLPGSGKAFWWQCEKRHEWRISPNHRTSQKTGCPYCSGRKAWQGYNDLLTLRPDIAAEWDYIKNGDLKPTDVTCGSHKKAWWLCKKCNNSWRTSIHVRSTHNCGCPICGLEKGIAKRTEKQTSICNLAAAYPEIAKWWHPTKNGQLTPYNVGPKSHKKVWWSCSKGHEFALTPSNKIKTGCPVCSGRLVIEGVNDLSTTHPEIAKEWNYEKNHDLTPQKVSVNSYKNVWWKCSKGHEWRSWLYIRAAGHGCSLCAGVGTSLPEQGIAFYLDKIVTINQRIKVCGKEIDVFLPNYNIGIEYDGSAYHNEQTIPKEIEKQKVLERAGIKLIRIKESDKNKVIENNIFYKKDNMGINYNWALKSLFSMLFSLTCIPEFKKLVINAQSDRLKILERFNTYKKEKSFVNFAPKLLLEWNYDKNGELDPESFSFGSDEIVWWKCSKNHEWKAAIHTRVAGHGCPYCAGRLHSTIICIETGQTYNSFKSAGLTTNTNPVCISKCCKGKQQTAGGYHWKYVSDGSKET